MTILIDASIFCSYANMRDVHHQHARKILQSIEAENYGQPFTTDYIFDETVTVAQRKASKEAAILAGKLILETNVHLVRITREMFATAWSIFQKQNKLSFTDCTIIAAVEILQIQYVATFDKELKNSMSVSVIDQ